MNDFILLRDGLEIPFGIRKNDIKKFWYSDNYKCVCIETYNNSIYKLSHSWNLTNLFYHLNNGKK